MQQRGRTPSSPGEAGADPALVNDLDLEVTAGDGTSYVGNALEGSWSVTGGSPDRINNIENVFIREPGDGTYTITVSAWNLPGDGVPGHQSLTVACPPPTSSVCATTNPPQVATPQSSPRAPVSSSADTYRKNSQIVDDDVVKLCDGSERSAAARAAQNACRR
jgi:hypothetical protein